MSNERLQRVSQYRTALAHHRKRGWEFITMTMEKLNGEKERLKSEYNGNGFNKWYRTVSLELIGGLLCLLVTIFIGIISYNFIQDSQAHTCYIQTSTKLQAEKIDKHELKYESERIRAKIDELCRRHEADVDKISAKLDESVKEIKSIVMQKYYLNK